MLVVASDVFRCIRQSLPSATKSRESQKRLQERHRQMCSRQFFAARSTDSVSRRAAADATPPPEIDSRTRGFLYGTVRAVARAVGQFELLREPIPRSFIGRSRLYFVLLKCTVGPLPPPAREVGFAGDVGPRINTNVRIQA